MQCVRARESERRAKEAGSGRRPCLGPKWPPARGSGKVIVIMNDHSSPSFLLLAFFAAPAESRSGRRGVTLLQALRPAPFRPAHHAGTERS